MPKISTHCLALSCRCQVDINLEIVDDCDLAEAIMDTCSSVSRDPAERGHFKPFQSFKILIFLSHGEDILNN